MRHLLIVRSSVSVHHAPSDPGRKPEGKSSVVASTFNWVVSSSESLGYRRSRSPRLVLVAEYVVFVRWGDE